MILSFLHGAVLTLVAIGGWAVVRERDPLRQTLVLGFYGVLLAVEFMMLQAPDVALSQIAVGTVAVPLLLLLTLAKARAEHAPELPRPPEETPDE